MKVTHRLRCHPFSFLCAGFLMSFHGHSCPLIMIICIKPQTWGADAGMALHVFFWSNWDGNQLSWCTTQAVYSAYREQRYCRQGPIFLILLTRASPHMLDTIWVKQVYLRLIRPQDMVPLIHALGQVVSKLFAGFFCEPASEEASFWDDANRLVAVRGV